MRRPPPSTLLVGYLLYSLRPRSSIAAQAHRAPLGLGPAGNDQGQGDMVDRRPATAVILFGRATLFACHGAGARAYLSMPFYAAFQAPCVASGGTRGRALWALKQKTGPVGLRFPPLRGGASVFQLAPRYPPSASWGLRRRLRRGWKGGAGHRFPRPGWIRSLSDRASLSAALPHGILMLRLTKEDRILVKKTMR